MKDPHRSALDGRAGRRAAEIWRQPLPPVDPSPAFDMPRQNVTTKRFGRGLGAGRLSTAQVSITHDRDTARVVLEVDE